jgi:hypothetical protein
MVETIRCPRCAKELPDHSVFCRRCGCALARRVPPQQLMPPIIPPIAPPTARVQASVQVTPPPPAPRPAKKSSSGPGIVVILGVIAAVAFFNSRLSVKKPAIAPKPLPTFTDIQSRIGSSTDLEFHATRAAQKMTPDRLSEMAKAVDSDGTFLFSKSGPNGSISLRIPSSAYPKLGQPLPLPQNPTLLPGTVQPNSRNGTGYSAPRREAESRPNNR